MTEKLLDLTKTIVSGYVANNAVPVAGLPGLIADVASVLNNLSAPLAPEPEKPVPAVNPKRSVHRDYIISLETGEGFKSLTRHLSARGLTPETYRAKWGLPADYPMVAASYAEQRSALAKASGLGRKPKPTPESAAVGKKRGRPAKVVEAAPAAAPAVKGRAKKP